MNINKSVNDDKVKSLLEEYNQWIEAVKWLRQHVKKFHAYVKKSIIPCIQTSSEKSKKLDYTERFIYLFNIFLAEYDFLTTGNRKLKMYIDDTTGYHHTKLLDEITKLSGKKFSDKKSSSVLEALCLRTQNWNIRDIFEQHEATVNLFVTAINDILILQNSLLLDLVEKTYIISYKMILDDTFTKIDNKRLSFPSRAKFREWFEKLQPVQAPKEIMVETNSASSSLTTLDKGAAAKERPTSCQSLEKQPLVQVTKHTTIVKDDDEIGASTGAHTAPAVKKRTISTHDDDDDEKASSVDSKSFSGKYFVLLLIEQQ